MTTYTIITTISPSVGNARGAPEMLFVHRLLLKTLLRVIESFFLAYLL